MNSQVIFIPKSLLLHLAAIKLFVLDLVALLYLLAWHLHKSLLFPRYFRVHISTKVRIDVMNNANHLKFVLSGPRKLGFNGLQRHKLMHLFVNFL